MSPCPFPSTVTIAPRQERMAPDLMIKHGILIMTLKPSDRAAHESLRCRRMQESQSHAELVHP